MTIYENIKAAISVKQAAEHYGLKVNRSGMTCCPFHNDRHPSLKLNEDYFFCFGCGAKGDVIDLVAKLFNLSNHIPVVEKQILWSKRCKDEALRGTVKETITQVSRSKKWDSKPVLDEDGNPKLNEKGKKILRSSYSVLQDDFFNFMRAAGYTDVERGSTEEHLTVTQFKVQAEQQRLEAVTGQVAQAEQSLEDAKAATEKQKKKLEALQKETKAAKAIALTVQDIEAMGKKATFGNNITLTPDECDTLKRYATNGILFHAENERLKGKLESAQKSASIWKQRCEEANKKYQELKQKAQPFLDALEIASEKVRAFINSILARGKETQEHKAPARKRGQDMEI